MLQRCAGAAASATLLLAAAPATATPDLGARQVVTVVNHYLPGDDELAVPTLVVEPGGRLQYTNLDAIAAHDVTDEGCRSATDAVPCRFSSPTVGRDDGTVEVDGVSTLAPGSYRFYCTVHPSTMVGTLVIEEVL